MKSLRDSLKESDTALLPVIAKVWGLDPAKIDSADLVSTILAAMLDENNALKVWDKLDDEQRGALQSLLDGFNAGKMTLLMFERMFGEIRKMGAGAIEREQPHLTPATVAEGLYYRGLIYEAYEQASMGVRPVIYVPADLVAVLPTHKTAYEGIKDEPLFVETPQESFFDDDGPTIDPLDADSIQEIQRADTTVVDDFTTLLAYLQVEGAKVDEGGLSDLDVEEILPHLIYPEEDRLTFIFGLGVGASLIEILEDKAAPRRAEVRRWLEAKRPDQLQQLANAWRTSAVYRDLWHVPGLHPEPTGWSYDAAIARKAFVNFVRAYTPTQDWWSIDDFIMTIKEIEPDFQRPGGDYNSWYIRNDNGEYLNGFDSWDAVEGALLEFYLLGPLSWLGLVDLAEDAAHLNAYGRAFIMQEPFPESRETDEKIDISADGTLRASRRVPRIDRFQAMRFTTWQSPPTPEGGSYIYKLDAGGIQKASEQNINTGHITAFISRMLDDEPIPPRLVKLLETWQSGPSSNVTVERLLVLRTTSPEEMDFIHNEPSLRRYLGARLGPMAAAVRADQWEGLKSALESEGIKPELIE
jgi:hypothetical protein